MRGAYDLETTKFEVGKPIIPFFSGSKLENGYEFSFDARIEKRDPCKALLEFMLASQVKEWWAHNGGKFDLLFLVEAARLMGLEQSGTARTDGRVIHWMFKHNGTTIHCRDTQALVPGKLVKIAEAFQLKSRKQFSAQDYEGDLFKRDTAFVRQGCLADCSMVLELVSTVESLAQGFGAKMGNTAAGTAFSILKAKIAPAKVPDHHLDPELRFASEICREAFRGGRVEVFHHDPGFILQEFDINSSYPKAMSGVLPWKLKDFTNDRQAKIDFENGEEGVFRATVNVPKMSIPALPYLQDGSLFYPVGEWEGYFTAVELRYAEKLGVKIDVKDGVTYSSKKPFSEYIAEMYEIKRTSIGPKREFAKLCLNASYGKMAQMGAITRMQVFPSEHAAWDFGRGKATDYVRYRESVVTMPLEGKSCLFIQYGERLQPHTHFAIAAYVTAIARINMHKGLLACDFPCYGDTDSVHARGPGKIKISDLLGDFKHAQKDFSARYYAPKLYEMKLQNGEEHYKSKGFAVDAKTFRKVVACLPVEQRKIRTLRKQLKADDGLVMYIEQLKLWHGLSNKRRPLKDGSTIPWSVEELVRGDHLKAASPIRPKG